MIFHNGSNYHYHFIIKELAKEFEEEFNCLGENTKKYKPFSVPITKEIKRIDKNGEEITKTISYKLQFIDGARFMASSLWKLVDNLAEWIHKIKCNMIKYGHDNQKCETYAYFLLQKSVYPYEYVDDWEIFKETSLPEKQYFHSQLNMEDISDVDYTHVKRVCKDFKIKNLGEYHNLYVQIDTTLLAHAFNSFRYMCLKI